MFVHSVDTRHERINYYRYALKEATNVKVISIARENFFCHPLPLSFEVGGRGELFITKPPRFLPGRGGGEYRLNLFSIESLAPIASRRARAVDPSVTPPPLIPPRDGLSGRSLTESYFFSLDLGRTRIFATCKLHAPYTLYHGPGALYVSGEQEVWHNVHRCDKRLPLPRLLSYKMHEKTECEREKRERTHQVKLIFGNSRRENVGKWSYFFAIRSIVRLSKR